MKTCRRCHKEKDYSDFFKDKKASDELRSWCKECWMEYSKKYAKAWRIRRGYKPKHIREDIGFSKSSIGRYGYKLLKTIKETMGWKCSRCGSENDLTIHHKDHNGINLYKQKRYKEVNNNIENLEIICRSCHGAIHTVESRKNRKFEYLIN